MKKKARRYLRLLGLVLLMLLAAAGVGLTGAAPISQKKDRYIDNEVKTELVERKQEEGPAELGQE
ncbi:hypothetical protein GCM10023185_28850 [Hymenobacter saemangeumensis]|uniref:Secreted protein n=1 Tax=Hymenobacter saemangeumensis TaxID=1084522 RepID=A0ABP8IKM4_9BACT